MTSDDKNTVQFQLHPLRHAVTDELHTRTFEPLCAPARVAHFTAVCRENDNAHHERHLLRLLEYFDAPLPEQPLGQHYFADLDSLRLRWERHTEFVTYSLSCEQPFTDPFAQSPLDDLPADWLRELPGEVITVVLLALESRDMPQRTPEDLAELFHGNPVIGAEVAGGAGKAWSDLRIQNDNYGYVLVRDECLSPLQAGRLVKRVLEINTYRAMALLGLPVARETAAMLNLADQRLTEVARSMARIRTTEALSERNLLVELTQLATEIEAISAQSSYRFEASRAYSAVVEQRLAQLREQRIEGLQTFTEFLNARLAPAVATCVSVNERQLRLAERAARLTALLRARVEVSLQEQNRAVLDSMDRRARLQLRLQETVEGLSVIAISYYGLSLIAYILKGLTHYWPQLDPTLGVGIAVPFVVVLTWLLLQHTKRRLQEGHDD